MLVVVIMVQALTTNACWQCACTSARPALAAMRDCYAEQVAKPVFAFPLADYAEKRHDIVLHGRLEKLLAGDAWGASLPDTVRLMPCCTTLGESVRDWSEMDLAA